MFRRCFKLVFMVIYITAELRANLVFAFSDKIQAIHQLREDLRTVASVLTAPGLFLFHFLRVTDSVLLKEEETGLVEEDRRDEVFTNLKIVQSKCTIKSQCWKIRGKNLI